MNTRRTRTAVLALVSAPLALALVACGGDDSSDNDDTGTTSGATSTAPGTTAPPTTPVAPAAPAPATTEAGGTTGSGADDAALTTAAATALGVVEGTVFTVDRDNGGWEVSVVADDGTESDVTVSADGTQVTRGPVVDTDDSDDSGDLAERRQLLTEATVTLDEAVAAARAEVPAGAIDGIDLDLDRGQATWEGQLDEDGADEQTVVVDAVTGAVIGVEQDD